MLLRPLRPYRINQKFGQNNACINDKTNKVITKPAGGKCPVGYRSLYGTKGHGGLDLFAVYGQHIHASHDGIVTEYVAETDRGLGLGITSKTKARFKETGSTEYYKTRYWHQFVNLVNIGDEVKAGQVIALADTTGYSSGNHLHYELKPVKVKTRKGKIISTTNILQDNGHYGSIDPEPYMSTLYGDQFTGIVDSIKRLIQVIKFLK